MTFPKAPLLMVASSSRTGPAEGLLGMAAWLRARGIDARCAFDSVRPGDIGEHAAAAGVPWVRELHVSRKFRLRDVLRDARNLATWAREGTPDLLHTSFAHDHHLALWAAARAGKQRENLRVVRAAHRRIDVTRGRFGERRWALRRTDGVVVWANAYRDALLEMDLDPQRVVTLPSHVDAGVFTPGESMLRREWSVPDHAPLAGIVARMKPERLHEQLLKAWRLVDVPHARLVLVGRGEDEQRLRDLADDRVVFGGYQRGPELVAAYRALDVAIWLREGNDGACRGVLEAMACGKPVIAGDDGAPAELVTPACGRVVDPFDTPKLARALNELLANRRLAQDLGRAARARAEEHTPERAFTTLLQFWQHLRALPPAS